MNCSSFPCTNGALWEVAGKWVVAGSVDVDIGASPSAEGGEDDEEGVEVVDIVDTFRLQEVIYRIHEGIHQDIDVQVGRIEATEYLLFKIKDNLQSMQDDSILVFVYHEEGATDPTLMFFGHGLKEIEC
ncbi:hypothetical protein C2S51_021466 [Perilla frutescens var. frutescens]|nr:hypothetical protein C2S51_021466 [Perilla frutescens var. frutescens]